MKIEEVHNNIACKSKRYFSTIICPCRSNGPCCRSAKQKSRKIQLLGFGSASRCIAKILLLMPFCALF